MDIHRELFQFQYGAIKRLFTKPCGRQLTKFQFQYGAIKRFKAALLTLSQHYFNSSMVRLRGTFTGIGVNGNNLFQFQYGAIKRLTVKIGANAAAFNFNSSMVRLREKPT